MKDREQYFAVIVYPEDSGNLLALEFLKYDIPCICITPLSSSVNPLNQKLYHDVICGNELAPLLPSINHYNIYCCIPGSERGVPLADSLSSHFDTYPNKPSLTGARYNKSEMAATAKAAGLLIPQQTTVSSIGQLDTLITDGINWPVIIKPDNSKGSEGIQLCQNIKELRQAFQRIIHIRNNLGRINHNCIVQEFMQGTEYVVDSVSYNGKHKITGIWEYHKLGPEFISIATFHSLQLLPFEGTIQTQLRQYTYQLLDALGIRYGAAHTELMLENGDVKLMEIGARLHGGTPAVKISTNCTGKSQVELCVLAYLNPKEFLTKQHRPYTLTGHGEIVLLITPDSMRYANTKSVDRIRSLNSVIQLDIDTSNTKPLNRIAGLVTLQHNDKQIISQDLKTIQELEASELYSLTP